MRDRYGDDAAALPDDLWGARERRAMSQDRPNDRLASTESHETAAADTDQPRGAETLTEPETDMAPRRTVLRLSEGERDAIWQYDDPLWRAHYAWHPEDGWLYWTRINGHWSLSSAAHGDVTNHSITLNRDANRYTFTEIARFRHWGAVLFTPNGEPLPVPDSMDTTLPREVTR